MKIAAKLFNPRQWTRLDRALQKRFVEVDAQLRAALTARQPTYEALTRFVFQPALPADVRQSVAQVVKRRARHSYTMTHEIVCFHKAAGARAYQPQRSLYDAACAVRCLLFGAAEPLRTVDMTITYHPWMRIAIPAPGDPLFDPLSRYGGGPALFGAINLYLVLLTAHPYLDGNGRTSRLMFNLHLAQAYGMQSHYIPLSELTRATKGIYEEYIGSACRHGDFRQLVWHLLALLQTYAAFLRQRIDEEEQSDLQKVLRLAAPRNGNQDGRGINELAPYLVSVRDTLSCLEAPQLNRLFMDAVLEIADRLGCYGTIRFALTGLGDLATDAHPRCGAIAFFIEATRKEDLILHFRELRSRYGKTIRLQVAIATGDAALDAKLLINLVGGHDRPVGMARNIPVLLHDFPAARSEPAGSLHMDLDAPQLDPTNQSACPLV